MSTSPHALPGLTCFLDTETTGMDPRTDDILEIAYVITESRFPYVEVCRGHHLVSSEGRIALLNGMLHEEVQTMHERSGLRADLAEVERTETLPSVESVLLKLSEGWPTEGRRVSIAGFGPKFDLDFLRRQMPRFAARLSHQVFDVTSLKLQCLSLGMIEEGKTEPVHRAMADVEASIVRARRYLGWLTHLLADHGFEEEDAGFDWCGVCGSAQKKTPLGDPRRYRRST